MKYWLEYHIEHKGTFDKYFDHYPTEEETHFLVERNDISRATLWKQINDKSNEFIRVIDLI